MTRTLVRVSDGLLALLQAVADRVEHLLALGGEGSDGSLPAGPGGGDLAVEPVEAGLGGPEVGRGRGGRGRPAGPPARPARAGGACGSSRWRSSWRASSSSVAGVASS